jgi:hypothetical protein
MDNPETRTALGTRHKRENQEWTIQRQRQHWCPMLSMSLDCPFLIAISVSSAQCCLCLWIVHSWFSLLCLVPNAVRVSGLMDNPETQAKLGTRHRRGNQEWTIQRHRQHLALDTEREIKNGQSRDTDSMCLVPNVTCVSGLSIFDCPFCVWWPMLHMSLDCPFLIASFLSSVQCCLCLWIFCSWLRLLCLVPNVACVSGEEAIKNGKSRDTVNIGH